MSTFLYFAYGSNMLAERLQARCPSARALSVGACASSEYDLLFHKRSIDGSGKAAMAKIADGQAAAKIFGVIYEVAVNERNSLDRFEGDGYDRNDELSVTLRGTSKPIAITSYIAHPDALTPTVQPYDWYMALVIAGARQHGLPQDYVACLKSRPVQPDPEPERRRRVEAHGILQATGYPLAG